MKLPSGDQHALRHHGGVSTGVIRATGKGARRSHTRIEPSIEAAMKVESEVSGASSPAPFSLCVFVSISSAWGRPLVSACGAEFGTPFATERSGAEVSFLGGEPGGCTV